MNTVSRFASALLLLAAVVGCSTVKEVDLPDGQKGYSMHCAGDSRPWEKCLSRVEKICGTTGYELVSRSWGEGRIMPTPPNVTEVYPQPYSDRTLVFRCL